MSIRLIPSGMSSDSNAVLLIIPDRRYTAEQAQQLLADFQTDFRSFVVAGDPPSGESVEAYARELEQCLVSEGVKWVTAFGIGSGASAAQALTIQSARMVRRVVLLDATTRFEPGLVQRAIDRLERFFPLGLPLRRLTKQYDSRPMLHRIHCPALVLLSPTQGGFIEEQGRNIAQRIPNAWFRRLREPAIRGGKLGAELHELLSEFLEVPVKRPQKVRARAA
ncbi:MAG: hypothetical protein KDD69_17420 [Bdellovibrionales bacterium]|nr:hypothetical protein [Bdellovibrionales bacterium]